MAERMRAVEDPLGPRCPHCKNEDRTMFQWRLVLSSGIVKEKCVACDQWTGRERPDRRSR